MKKNKTIISNNKNIKIKIAKEVARQQSYLIGYFIKSSIPDLVVSQWAAVSLSNPKFLQTIAREFYKIIKKDDYDLICGIETAGIALASATSIKSGIPWVYARKERKKSGGMEAFEGTYKKNNKVIFVDNFSATGKGMISIIKNAQEEKFIFNELLVIVDNQWDKIEEYNKYIQTYALITNKELTYYLNELGYFPGNLYKYCKMYIEYPERLKVNTKNAKDFIKELEKAPNLPYIKKNTLN